MVEHISRCDESSSCFWWHHCYQQLQKHAQINTLKVQTLHRYYPKNHPVPIPHRISGNLMDKILTSDRSELEKHLILWRANQFGRGKGRLCLCLEPFTQSHTTSCAELAGIPVFDIDELISRSEWAKLDTILHDCWTISNAVNIEWLFYLCMIFYVF